MSRADFDPKAFTSHAAALLRWRNFHPPLLAIALAGVIWSVTVFYFVWQWEDRQAERNLNQTASMHFMALQTGLNEYINKLTALRAFFEASDEVSRPEFERFTTRLLERDTTTQNFSWAPRIGNADRETWQLTARREGIPNYEIRAALPGGRIVPSPERSEYLPIFYSSIKDRLSPIYGIDLLSQPMVKPRLERARDTNQISTVPDFQLNSRGGLTRGILLSLPLYRRGMPIDTVEQRRENFIGVVHGAFITSEAVEHTLNTSTEKVGLNIYLYSPDAKPDDAPLYTHKSRLTDKEVTPRSERAATTGLHARGTLRAGTEEWRLVAVPVPGGPLATHHDRAWLVLLCNLVVAFFTTVYEKRMVRANRRIVELAERDPLTQLANRRAFNTHLSAAFAASRNGGAPFSLLYFDLDDFKDINDTRGHPVGDLLLKEVATRVRHILRQTDVFARFGGDEFAILQLGATEHEASLLASRINAALAAPYRVDGTTARVTASIGIAVYSADTKTPDALLVQADLALYRAKQDGRNCFRLHSLDLDRAVGERVIIADELRNAIENNELRLWYQPQVELGTGAMIGLEGLIRWEHPTRGLVLPSEFIPVAEQTGQIDKIGLWVFEEACRQTRAWRDAGLAPGPISVNVSGNHLKANPELHLIFASLLKKHGVQPSAIQIELTESVMMEVSAQHSDILERLRQIELRISIDDFGTGYSSLNYLTRFPISRLKIAQELVLGIVDDNRNAAVVRATIHMAEELGIECMAEGVETARHRDMLVKYGCPYGQGFYFSRPLSPQSMTVLLQQESGQLPAKRQFGLIAG